MNIATRPGRRIRQALVSLQIAALLALVPTTSFALDFSMDNLKLDLEINLDPLVIPFDIAILRPLGAIRLAVGSVALVPIGLIYSMKIPLDGGTGALQEIAEILVVEPANFLFRRPLGEELSGE